MDVLERFFGGCQPSQNIGDGGEQQLAFIGQGQAAGMTLEQRGGDFLFQRADLVPTLGAGALAP